MWKRLSFTNQSAQKNLVENIEMKLVLGLLEVISIVAIMLLVTACGVSENTTTIQSPTYPVSTISPPTPSREKLLNVFRTTADENIKVTILEDTFSTSEEIRFKITVIGNGVYFSGPCEMWFERMEDRDWEEVGICPDTNFADEPFPRQPGDEIELSLPISYDSEIHYSYDLTTGTYRYVITYWAHSDNYKICSAEFKIVEP